MLMHFYIKRKEESKTMFFQKDIETMPRKSIEKIQLERLKWLVDYCNRNVKFYHDRLERAGVTADKIKSLEDIQYIPYTTKEDIRDNYPSVFSDSLLIKL